MDNADFLEKFVDFLNEFYKDELVKAANEGRKSISADFSLLEKFDVEIADYLLENPAEVFPIIEKAAKEIDVGNLDANFRVRLFNLPENPPETLTLRSIKKGMIRKQTKQAILRRLKKLNPEISGIGDIFCED